MGSPLWVKPSRLGSSVGISRVEDTGAELDEAVELALRHDPRVIVEASAEGREVECSLLGNEEVEVSPPGEIVAHGEWYDYETKYRDGGMELVVPAPIPDEQADAAARAGGRGPSGSAAAPVSPAATSSSSPTGAILVNEINTMPGFTETSVYAKLWEAAGVGYPRALRPAARARRRAPRAGALARVLTALGGSRG